MELCGGTAPGGLWWNWGGAQGSAQCNWGRQVEQQWAVVGQWKAVVELGWNSKECSEVEMSGGIAMGCGGTECSV